MIMHVSLMLIVVSWFLYPMLAVWFFPVLRYVVIGLIILLLSLIVVYRQRINFYRVPKVVKYAAALYAAYFFCLGVASIMSDNSLALEQYAKYAIKVLFFILVLLAMDELLLRRSFSLYAHTMLALVVVGLFIAVLIAIFYIQPFFNVQVIAVNGHSTIIPYYGLVFYGQAPFPVGFPWARLQGLSEEPGTFALALLPAYFWFLLVEKSLWKLVTVVIGIAFTFSFGAVVFLVLVAIYVFVFRLQTWSKLMAHTLTIGLIVALTFAMTDEKVMKEGNYWDWSSWVSMLEQGAVGKQGIDGEFGSSKEQGAVGKQGIDGEFGSSKMLVAKYDGNNSSMGQRMEHVKKVWDYLIQHPFGTGAGVGIETLKQPIAVGYALAALEAGLIGGGAYFLFFIMLTYFAISVQLAFKKTSKDMDLIQTLGFSVLALLFFGAQRLQPDLSFWQMWIYAMFIWLFIRELGANTKAQSNEMGAFDKYEK